MTREVLKHALGLIPALAVYIYFALDLNMIQDDAFISFRYVANYLNGDGLVFNAGELVEGYTNFGWVVYLAFIGVLGLDYILISQITGATFGGLIIVVTYLTAEKLLPQNRKWLALIPTYLVGANMSLGYWAPAGLETAAFAFFAALALYLFLRQSWWLIWAMVMAVWIRPEGALVVALLIVTELVVYRRLPRFTFLCAAIAFVTSLPYVAFKVSYYGSIFPNPFYAKTGFGMAQLQNGWEYSWRFLQHYGFWGAGIVVSALFLHRLPKPARAVWLFAVVYMLYILLVGGDVLKVHRFYLPIIGAVAIQAMLALWGATRQATRATAYRLATAVTLVLLAITILSPHDFVKRFNFLEKALVRKMQFMADNMRRSDPRRFSVALPTIGAFSYRLVGHEIIDMLGLTDSTIARHSEEPVPGMKTTWKEQKHNSAYLLTREPDYILFSTGIKPSAPAEMALFLYPEFLDSYYMVGWYFKPEDGSQGLLQNVHKRRNKIRKHPQPKFSVEYVQAYKLGIEALVVGDKRRAISRLQEAVDASPPTCHDILFQRMGYAHKLLGEHDTAQRLLDSSLALDSMNYEAHRDLMMYSLATSNADKARLHMYWLKKLVPWYWPRMERKLDRQTGGQWRQFLGTRGG